jgi:signal transduction histidine kinase
MNPQPVPEAGVVHDLGNLIQIATSAINILHRNEEMRVAGLEEVVAGARASLEQAGALVTQTLRREPGAARAGDAADVAACLAEVHLLVRTLDSGLFLNVRIGPGVPAAACDATGLKSALLNLVFNARDAMAGVGLVSIRVMRAARAGGAAVEIHVADTGVGMSPQTVARAFDPFFTTKCDGLGGVGLPMVERFVRDAGGTISIESEEGVGTNVILHLPAAAVRKTFIREEPEQ